MDAPPIIQLSFSLNCRISQNNWIRIKYTPLQNAFRSLLINIFQQIYYANASCNFILYILTGQSFRRQLIEMFTFSKKQNSATTTMTTATKHSRSYTETGVCSCGGCLVRSIVHISPVET